MYAELVCRSNFSFLRGASHPEELVARGRELGLEALALTDDDGLYGLVKAHLQAKALGGPRLIVGARLSLLEGAAASVVLYVESLEGYRNLCRLISESRLAHPKGHAGLPWGRVAERSGGLLALLPVSPEWSSRSVSGGTSFDDWPDLAALAEAFPGRFYVGISRALSAQDERLGNVAARVASRLEVPLCAHNDVHTHERRRQPLQDVMTAIRLGTTVAQAGARLFPNGERTLKGPAEMARLFADLPEAVGRTLEIAEACRFSLDELRYEFSRELLPEGWTPQRYLEHLTRQGLQVRYPGGVPGPVLRQVEHELAIIEQRQFAGYFLAIWDIVRFARERGILCQGRGSAANSAVCYALQITSIDPVRMGLLFERFISMERKEPPDIDVDFEHERREEVLQYVYQKHGRERAAMVCEVICYRGRLSLRETGKALGLSLDQVDRLTKQVGMGGPTDGESMSREAGLSSDDLRVRQTLALSRELEGAPRHLSIHVGGFVITDDPLVELVPVENAAMKDRTVVQWEKDDLNAVNILKVDLLGLGMLTVLSKTFALVREHYGADWSLATIPPEDPKVYEMICEADTVGVFQIESRAQMNMLPRLRPKTFYDLVIEIAIIRPGPIVGEMVHPFLRRRDGLEPVSYPSPEVRSILERTLGVPLFQEQAMRLAMVAAGFTAGEADALRRVLSHKRALELLLPFRERFIEGCLKRGYAREFAESCFNQFKGFAHYGFPESHSASFALIAYASSWLKRYYPAAFTAALINSQPMGFYAVHTLVEDARRHGVEVRPIDVNASDWDCTLEPASKEPASKEPASKEPASEREGSRPSCALRLGLRLVKGLREESAKRLVRARASARVSAHAAGNGSGFSSIGELARRTRLARHELTRLAAAGALLSLSGSRRQALWELQALGPLEADDLFFGMPMDETPVALPPMSVAERVSADYQWTGLSLEQHPVSLLRPQLSRWKALTAAQLASTRERRRAGVGGLVLVRQRPPTAKGFTFMSIEDETGIANLVIEPPLFERYRKEIVGALFVYGEGRVERAGKVVNLKVDRLRSLELSSCPL